ncbi:hemin uptake protein HemP [Ramlibacter montanisoli]|nr:hemin uptake protein HemP [Ramlibacter montanisoli]
MELRAPDAHADAPRPAPLPSEALLRGRRLVEISHNGEVYRLQSTRLGKLILTK